MSTTISSVSVLSLLETMKTEIANLTVAINEIAGKYDDQSVSTWYGVDQQSFESLTKAVSVLRVVKTSAVQQLAGYGVDFSTPLTVVSISPVSGTTGVATTASVAVTFNKKVSPENPGQIILKQGTAVVAGTNGISGNVATFKPTSNLAGTTAYSAVAVGFNDWANNAMVAATISGSNATTGTSGFVSFTTA